MARALSISTLLALTLLPMGAHAAVYACSEAGLNAGFATGGLVQFSCTAGSMIPVTATKVVSVSGTVIDGQGKVTLQGNTGIQLFVVGSGTTATFRNLTISGASVPALGAVISGGSGSSVTLDMVTVQSNDASSGGAQIYSSSGSITATNSTFASGNGNGIMGDTATLSVTSSTFSGVLRGVVARNGTTATVRHSTFVNLNTGVQSVGATDSISLGHVLFSNNAADVSGATVTSVGFNLIEDGLSGAQSTDRIGVAARVSALAANGGPTPTVALQACSPAIDSGQSPATLSFDQRGSGFPRVLQARQDIGAFESNFTAVPCITTQPTGQTVFATQTLSLTVAAITGVGTLSYQWRKGGTPIPGATSVTYTKTAVLADAGNYDVVVTNSAGNVISNTVTVTVNGPPAITMQPVGQTLFATQTISLSATASGASLTYRWRKNGTPIAGAVSATYTKSAVVGDSGDYDLVVTNPAGSVTSNTAMVTVDGPPSITSQPMPQSVYATQPLTLSVTASGNGLTYQWNKDGMPIAGATAATYMTTATVADTGSYDVVVTNPAGSVSSTMVAVTVEGPPVITVQPQDQSLFATQPLALSVTATGTGLTYQWRKEGMAISGATAAIYAPVATLADTGSYDVVVTNPAGSVSSDPVAVTVEGPATITVQPAPQSVFIGQTVSVTVTATGTSLTYQWRKDGAPIAGATLATYTTTAALSDAGSYDVVISNPAGEVTSDAVTVTIKGAPVITMQPQAASLMVGQPLTLSLVATGESLTYTWRRGGTQIPQATTAMLSISSVTLDDAGSYECVVSNPSGTVTSNPVTVEVSPAQAMGGGGGGDSTGGGGGGDGSGGGDGGGAGGGRGCGCNAAAGSELSLALLAVLAARRRRLSSRRSPRVGC